MQYLAEARNPQGRYDVKQNGPVFPLFIGM